MERVKNIQIGSGYLNRSKCKICEPGDISSGNIKVRKTVNGQHRCVNLAFMILDKILFKYATD